MFISPVDEKPWFKDYYNQYSPKEDELYPIVKIIIASKGGYILVTEEFKCFLFPKSNGCALFKKYLNEINDQTSDQIVVIITPDYPYWALSTESTVQFHYHNYDDKEIQISKPSPPTLNTKSKSKGSDK